MHWKWRCFFTEKLSSGLLCHLRLMAGHAVMELGTPVSTRKTGFQSSRSSWQHLTDRDNMCVITVIGSMVKMASRAP